MTQVSATVAPATVRFGEPFRYTVAVHAPSGANAVQVLAGAGTFDQVGAASVHRDGSTVTTTETLVCLGRGCLPVHGARAVALPAPQARAGGRILRGRAAVVTVTPRVPQKAVSASRPGYVLQTGVPRVGAPFGAVAVVAIVVAVVLAGLAVLLVVGDVRRRAAERRAAAGRRPVDLRLALQLLRESAARPASDRRRAADLAARVAPSDTGADEATRLAWAPPEPEPEGVVALADELEAQA